MQRAGLLSLTVPRECGGGGAGLAEACAVVEQIAGGEPSTALVFAMHLIYHAVGREGVWDREFHARICKESVEGIALINVLRVEPALGTPTRGGLPDTTARRTADGWQLDGHKLYATGSPLLRYFLTWARTADDPPLVGWFAVPRDTPGMRIVETWDHLGMRATASHDVIFEAAQVPDWSAVALRRPEEWPRMDPITASWNNLVLSALYHGIARAAAEWLGGYLHERTPGNLGASLATLPRHQAAMGEIQALLFASDRLIYGLARDIDAAGYADLAPAQTSLAKYVATNNAVRTVDIALSLVGNPGLSRSNPLERYHRDVLCSRIHVPQDDMVLAAAGRAALGV